MNLFQGKLIPFLISFIQMATTFCWINDNLLYKWFIVFPLIFSMIIMNPSDHQNYHQHHHHQAPVRMVETRDRESKWEIKAIWVKEEDRGR